MRVPTEVEAEALLDQLERVQEISPGKRMILYDAPLYRSLLGTERFGAVMRRSFVRSAYRLHAKRPKAE